MFFHVMFESILKLFAFEWIRVACSVNRDQCMIRFSAPCYSISFVFCGMRSELIDFIQTRAVVIDRPKCYLIYALVESFVGRQLLNRLKVRKRYTMHFVESETKPYAFIFHNLYFLLCFTGKIWVPSWASIVKTWLNKRIAEHFTKFCC